MRVAVRTAVAAPGDHGGEDFRAVVEAALGAFTADVSYAVAMARAAVVIGRKRAVWAARKELRLAQAQAAAECERTAAFHCHATSACGTGDCKFATGEHAQLAVPAPDGPARRPQHPHTGYSLDAAVAALADRRSPGL